MIKVVPQCNYVIISLTLTDCRGVLIPKLVSNLAVSDSSLIFFSFSLFLILSYLQIRIIHSLLYFLNYIGYYISSTTQVDISIMANKSNEFCYIALKLSQISSTIQYINETIQAMTDAWEDILLKIDRKITKYSKVCKNQSCLLSPNVFKFIFQLSICNY